MRKLFTERARIVIYLEKSDELRMTSRAKEDGETLVEWARNALLNELRIERPNELPGAGNSSPRIRDRVRPRRAPAKTVRSDGGDAPNTAAGPYDAEGRLGEGSIPNFRHTAESNWRTCLCGTCVTKRKDHGLQ